MEFLVLVAFVFKVPLRYPADYSRRGRVYTSVCLCLFVFPHDTLKINAASITKLDMQMFHDES